MSRKSRTHEHADPSRDSLRTETPATAKPLTSDAPVAESPRSERNRHGATRHERDLLPLHQKFLTAGAYLRNWSRTTLRTYAQSLHRLALEKPTKADLDAWVIRLRQQGLSPAGVNMYARAVNSYLAWMHEDGHAEVRLKIKLLRAPLHQHTLLTVAELTALLRFRPRTLGERRTHALILLLLDTGIRVNEALTLERSKIDFDNMLLTVFGKGAKERTVPFSLELRPVVFRWLSHPKTPTSPLVFVTRTGGRVSHRNAFREVQLMAKRAGVEAHVHPHLFRHQYAANFIRRGGDIYRLSRLLGHTTVRCRSRPPRPPCP